MASSVFVVQKSAPAKASAPKTQTPTVAKQVEIKQGISIIAHIHFTEFAVYTNY